MIGLYLHVTTSISLSEGRFRADISVIPKLHADGVISFRPVRQSTSYRTQRDSKSVVLKQLPRSDFRPPVAPNVRLIGLPSLRTH